MFVDKTELNPFLQAVVALLSMGPVGVGDRIGLSNVTLIQRLVMSCVVNSIFACNLNLLMELKVDFICFLHRKSGLHQ